MKKAKQKIVLATILTFISASVVGYAAGRIFKDVPENLWYTESVYNLWEKGIITGYPDNTYRPGNFVNRAELAKMLNNLINYLEKGESISLPEDPQDPLVMAENITLPQSLTLSVPFTAQAPNGDWNMPYQEACEEAAMIMVEYYLRNTYLDAGTANWEILNLIDYENENGYMVDVDTSETANIIENYYYRKSSPYYGNIVTVENIKKLLASGHPVIIPAAGRLLENPGYTGLGPEYHMIVIIGYDETGFTTHDPGILSGAFYHYSYQVIENAIHDFTGEKATIQSGQKAMIVFN